MREGIRRSCTKSRRNKGEQVEVYYQWVATDIHFPMKLGEERWELDRGVPACETAVGLGRPLQPAELVFSRLKTSTNKRHPGRPGRACNTAGGRDRASISESSQAL